MIFSSKKGSQCKEGFQRKKQKYKHTYFKLKISGQNQGKHHKRKL